MTDENTTHVSRRQVVAALGAAGTVGVSGCLKYWPPVERPPTERPTPTREVPSEDAGIEEWGERLNDHAKHADIDWQQFADEDITIRFATWVGPHSVATRFVKEYFTHLTGIEVEFEPVLRSERWSEVENSLAEQRSQYDGLTVGLWSAGGYHYGTDGTPWLRDLTRYIEDPELTDTDWLHMEDFRQDTITSLTFPDGEGGEDFVGFPSSIEVFGCPAIDVPTFEALGLDEPETIQELEEAARAISESDEVDREGIVSRTTSNPLASANWGTLFKTFGGEWIDRETREAALDSPEGIASLERFGELLREYGPENPGTRDWYGANNTFDEGEVGIMYSSPQASGVVEPDQIERTKFLPPVRGPNGEEPVVNTGIWSTGISQFSDHPEAAWLFIQWANSREANYMLSTRQWEGDAPRAGYARWNYIFDRVKNDPDTPNPPDGYEHTVREAMADVPTDPPPVPADTPRCMNIMSEAADAMESVVSGEQTAKSALSGVTPTVTAYAKEIPDRYLRN